MAKSTFSRTYMDYNKEKATVSFRIREMTAGSIAGILTDAAALGTAMQNLTLGVLNKSILAQDSSDFSSVPPTDANAQRERKWLIRYQATPSNKIGRIEIPCAALVSGGDPLHLPNSEMADFTHADWIGFNTAFELLGRSVDGESFTVLDAQLVGRNL